MDGVLSRPPASDVWDGCDATRVPYRVYRDPAIYAEELKRIFYGPIWHYVGLACELPAKGDFRRVHIGEREVLVVRNAEGGVSVMENRCAHRGAQVCQALYGNSGEALTCPYHQWTYDLDGRLVGLPFRRGIRGKGGMGPEFDLARHGLNRLQVATLNGLIFASFDASVPPLEQFLGPTMLQYLTRVFDGRTLRVVGYQRQMIDSNWKLQMENLKDPYHAGVLHLFLLAFGLFRLDQKSICYIDDTKGHSLIGTMRGSEAGQEDTGGVRLAAPDFALTDHRLIAPRKEFPDDVTLAIQTIFPGVIIQAQSNTLATRHVIPKGPGRHELIWTFFGYEDDDEELRTLRLRQANLMGAAGYVTLDDAEALEFSQSGFASAGDGAAAVLELGGDGTDPAEDHLVTEALIRGFYMRYRALMGADGGAAS